MPDRLERQAVAGRDLPPVGFCHHTPFDRTRFEPPRNVVAVNGKPTGGLWLSPLVDDDSPTPTTAWGHVAEEIFGSHGQQVVPVTMRDDARVLRIASHDDFVVALDVFPPPPSGMGGDIDGLFDRMLGRGLDYEAIARHFDAIWLTAEGANATRHTSPGLNMWDCETVLVLRIEALA